MCNWRLSAKQKDTVLFAYLEPNIAHVGGITNNMTEYQVKQKHNTHTKNTDVILIGHPKGYDLSSHRT